MEMHGNEARCAGGGGRRCRLRPASLANAAPQLREPAPLQAVVLLQRVTVCVAGPASPARVFRAAHAAVCGLGSASSDIPQWGAAPASPWASSRPGTAPGAPPHAEFAAASALQGVRSPLRCESNSTSRLDTLQACQPPVGGGAAAGAEQCVAAGAAAAAALHQLIQLLLHHAQWCGHHHGRRRGQRAGVAQQPGGGHQHVGLGGRRRRRPAPALAHPDQGAGSAPACAGSTQACMHVRRRLRS